jgi:glycosyltransferase involved in cell wall biosynthesis
MKTALYTTFYPAAKPYLQTWIDSVTAQSDQNFDLWIAVDDVDTKNLTLPRSNIHWLHANPDDTPASLRHRAFEEIIQAYDAVIFVDSDDVLLPERVAVAKDALKSFDVYGCALKLIDTNGQDLGQTFTTSRTDWPNLLSKYNIFGLSNTAYRTETLANCLPFPNDTVMVDWLLITNALHHNAYLYFDQTPHMLYRQYLNNTAKVLPPYTPEQISKATRLVLHHFDKILSPAPLLPRSTASTFHQNLEQRHQDVHRFTAATTDKTLLASYTKALNALKPVFLWWECVANEELRGIWDVGIRN